MSPPNPLKPIQEALERVLHESGLHDFGRSMSSIDDLTAEVQHVYQRVDDIERVLETIVPILERLTVVFEEIQADLEPMSELASKIPGSGSRRRRREKEGAALDANAALERGGVPAPPSARPEPRGPQGPSTDEARPVQGPAARPGGERPRAAGARTDAEMEPSSGGGVRPGATGYSPLGSRDRRDD